PAGGMPFMYSMTLMMLPPVIINVLLTFYPNNSHLLYLSQNIALTTLPGALIYIFILYLLSIGFAYYNYDAFEIAKNLRNNGDYIEHVIPGKETQKFLQRKIWVFANVGALFMILLGGAPLLLSFGDSSAVNIALSISNGYIIVSLIMGIIEQVQTLQMWKQYKDII
ncbi:MAG: accessory Sec system protein translocase subunit SecY2, partial [Streptococcus orisratti]|nr:accessory Sec system protein translocase subunit SecY2 [Streptococcus orisratti]